MPTVFVWRGHRFFFYSADGGEPAHVHIRKGASECKLWLHDARVAYNYGFASKDLSALIRQVNVHRAQLRKAWDDYLAD